ncbi:MAG TPA: TlpA disulfide reductase family protein [Vicinamibacteria bacterium]|jgi:thiol-disulfide isomerase/thioredoxin
MKGFFLAAVPIAALLLLSPAASAQDLDGKPAPEFSLKNMTGKTVSLSDYEGKVVLLDFWAVWCGPCKTSLPFLETLRKKYARHGFEVVGLHVDDRRPPLDQVMSYLRDRNVSYTNLISTFEVDEAFQLAGVPTSFVIGRDGTVQRTHIGFDAKTTPAKIEAQVRDVLGLP